jgi:hypothetical protein
MTQVVLQELQIQLQKYYFTYAQHNHSIEYFVHKGLPQSKLMIQTAGLNYKNGQINYFEWKCNTRSIYYSIRLFRSIKEQANNCNGVELFVAAIINSIQQDSQLYNTV